MLDFSGHGVTTIARKLGRDPGTISRELERGRSPDGRYRVSVAQQRCDERAKTGGRFRPAKIATNLVLRTEVQASLKQNHSPEQIAWG